MDSEFDEKRNVVVGVSSSIPRAFSFLTMEIDALRPLQELENMAITLKAGMDFSIVASPRFLSGFIDNSVQGKSAQKPLHNDIHAPHTAPTERLQEKMIRHERAAVKPESILASDMVCPDVESAIRILRNSSNAFISNHTLFALVLSFPFAFDHSPRHRFILDRLLCGLSDIPVVVEFRHQSWFTLPVFEALRQRNTGLCLSDFPRSPFFPPPCDLVTAPIVCMRLHGRTVFRKESSSDASETETTEPDSPSATSSEPDSRIYRYSGVELQTLAYRIVSLAQENRQIRIYLLTPSHKSADDAQTLQDRIRVLRDYSGKTLKNSPQAETFNEAGMNRQKPEWKAGGPKSRNNGSCIPPGVIKNEY